MLNDGDMYMMSEKAVGFDWLKKKVATLRLVSRYRALPICRIKHCDNGRALPARAPSAPVGRPKGGPTLCFDVLYTRVCKLVYLCKMSQILP